MKTYLDCIPCFFRQALSASREADADEILQKRVLDEISREIPKISYSLSPAYMSRIVYRAIRKITGVVDPFKKEKVKSNKLALKLYPQLKERIRRAKEPLEEATKLAILGNTIDFGIGDSFNLEKELNSEGNFPIFDYEEFKKFLKKNTKILYIADNCGETVFDRLLIEEMGKGVIYAVRSAPIINDATIEDAKFCGIDKIAKLIPSGSPISGTPLELCSQEFLSFFNQSSFIISKGQGNFETLSEANRPIFFLLKAKCSIVARELNCKIGDMILKYNHR
ncbi:MAG: hypothetical protein CO162_02135 [bacterium (Candidatus Ratteibacteria) CG_4_9_14_3_um_filter_41_21]|uniref:Damage-control phosphatase ARMT1-like metal-binding domain-containing protein n=4 Tax=Candidatus Ratteibacteria TaxID=2979319 RepID=A0A2M7YH00_9BACT|nr:MAG: hypothetical protein AUJ76_03385 [Candidatus Omnitrophica bacterium CG1_02_41_171]PIW33861.1 MAG: hypothetical protein COW28_02345 [bacterium (Candidatus Ratteibacteria) CG15_BIG_FIL_POST_REV_8_21_14_020_41_12]PIW74368.1 MAG: hypothetical protein CO004_01060 [bacterium (Candidatus Ratteibacteria) CG_4_8_14_3_um_filter_41_36]PJA62238.1 MAG: hypothetical protein CO162_02135 [bacterium (Candidatus Ratteibacteria) CG_4_9_14_3_um_filter_41_21]HCG76351.1 hypothetical protein [bacterium]